ncbi:nitrite/sulfite reductase [Methylotenera sp.]|uniref:nitrite/sulfite reductase n=1 Tax=Methylotenera sp. TaxID=2051956 RepID=UPI0027209470|nr:nitrite/sulfite reductase [Methylotenera sp.]MDO9206009.1 nitrite/sulfite reductase [Methylotenera sp.]MDP1522668.1 nitrite/sulfite reductase [Methylotenera sp.]MDP2071897.1 nitrite/sulfite reductase [Methylotenera sp.]MDP3005522.1 nitrite/sulfite reductase [Methylotenera sp.]
MYKYDEIDQQIVDERVAQYRDQTRRYLAGELSEDEFRPLRLQNGLYIQRQAPMLRIAVPYGMLSSKQLRKLGDIASKYDKGYGHFSTRQNLQLNWPKLEDVPDILAELATVEMHAIQTSGNCIRNITTDQFAGTAPDEIVDPRAMAEIMRQWSTFHPEFALLPRKFKIAVSGTQDDRAVVQMHDIGMEFYLDKNNKIAIKVWVGGGLGRTPILGSVIREHLEWQHALTYCEAIVRVYNLHGRRDNAYKARIKILVKALGIEEFKRQVEAEWAHLKDAPNTITETELARVSKHFDAMPYEALPAHDASFDTAIASNLAFAAWAKRSLHAHKISGYRAVTLSLKPHGSAPGDATTEQMHVVANLAEKYSFGELRVSHEQNLILADVKLSDLFAVWEKARANGLATPNIGLLTDIICCPGGDFCSLANAKSIPIAVAIQQQFDNLDYLHDIGDIELNISGCMNACGHHHIGHIGILGVDKDGSEWYQVTIGGSQGNQASIGSVIGPSFSAEEMPNVVQKLIEVYIKERTDEERFIDTARRLGVAPFKAHVYADKNAAKDEVAA